MKSVIPDEDSPSGYRCIKTENLYGSWITQVYPCLKNGTQGEYIFKGQVRGPNRDHTYSYSSPNEWEAHKKHGELVIEVFRRNPVKAAGRSR